MIGAPPPRPGKVNNRGTTNLSAITQAKKAAARKQLNKVVTKRKAKAQKPKADPKPEVIPEQEPRIDLPLIAQHCYLGQWQVLRTKPTSEGYICACICGQTAIRTKEELLAREVCKHKDSDQDFGQNRYAAREFKTLLALNLIPRKLINFNEFLKVYTNVKPGFKRMLLADHLQYDPSNLIYVAGRQVAPAEALRTIMIDDQRNALEAVKRCGLKLSNVLRYERNNGTPALVEYLRKRLAKFNESH